jgi:hypothetical protein
MDTLNSHTASSNCDGYIPCMIDVFKPAFGNVPVKISGYAGYSRLNARQTTSFSAP